ncbi:MAG: hypothetical protein ACFFB5_24975, partial [Promethearchaeota archaeon]
NIMMDDEENGEEDSVIEYFLAFMSYVHWIIAFAIDISVFLLSLIPPGGGGGDPTIAQGFTDSSNDTYSISWETGFRFSEHIYPYGGKDGPVHEGRTDTRFQAVWNTWLPSIGEFQIQYQYNIVVKLRWEGAKTSAPPLPPWVYLYNQGDIETAEINLVGEHFINFERLNPPN